MMFSISNSLLVERSDRQANRIIGVLKTCLKEGVFREELNRDPTLGIGNMKHEQKERGIFTAKELRGLFVLVQRKMEFSAHQE